MLTDSLDMPFSGKAKFCGLRRQWDYKIALFVGAPLQLLAVVGELVACDSLRTGHSPRKRVRTVQSHFRNKEPAIQVRD
jgi:hypothetical protein